MAKSTALVPEVNASIIAESGVTSLLKQIRPAWSGKGLIIRVNRLLEVDPSSACQRIFNASIHDLREKIVVAGIDIAADAATQFKLPSVSRVDDIEDYRVSKVIALAYRMGLLSRPEYRRLSRVYEIRRDLEHEDHEYEATAEDCFYIFKTCIEVVLSRDPVHLLKITDVKKLVEQPGPATVTSSVIEEFQHAPIPRQLDIYKFLISTILDIEKPDIVRQNCFSLIDRLAEYADNQVLIECSNDFIGRLGRRAPNQPEARLAFAAGIFSYLKKTMLKDFFDDFYKNMTSVGYNFQSHDKHDGLLHDLVEVGGIDYCPDDLLPKFLEWLILCYIGETSYGEGSRYRKVFFSNTGAPLAFEILKQSNRDLSVLALTLGAKSRYIKSGCADQHVARRFQELLDILEK